MTVARRRGRERLSRAPGPANPPAPIRSSPTGDGFHKLRSGIGVEAVVAVSQGSNNKPSDELRILHSSSSAIPAPML